jgi:RNA polymerase-interacting CarD/CdnL/TRCF family regulator
MQWEAIMNFQAGDTVMHWTYGLGTIIRMEKRDLFGHVAEYYAVKVGDMTVWVPADAKLRHRLRLPLSKVRFKRLLTLLRAAGEPLPMDRHERRLKLTESLQDGRAESLIGVIRGLAAFARIHALNENDQAFLRRARASLLSEWGYALSVTPFEAETSLHRLLTALPA